MVIEMKLSISNIAWTAEQDVLVYEMMKKYGFSGLEIAPTRVFVENPYDRNIEAERWSIELKRDYNFVIPSMQSIWFGRQEKVFGSTQERRVLIDYTMKAINFAAAIGCGNLVFGCPKNRSVSEDTDLEIGVRFFKEIGDYAAECGTTIGMEANPPIYNTNYINSTLSALELIDQVRSKGFLLNLDVGTMIQNQECVSGLVGKVDRINHIHISEPGLKPIEKRGIHLELRKVLEDEDYKGFVSIEMGRVDDIGILEKKMQYVRSVFR